MSPVHSFISSFEHCCDLLRRLNMFEAMFCCIRGLLPVQVSEANAPTTWAALVGSGGYLRALSLLTGSWVYLGEWVFVSSSHQIGGRSLASYRRVGGCVRLEVLRRPWGGLSRHCWASWRLLGVSWGAFFLMQLCCAEL